MLFKMATTPKIETKIDCFCFSQNNRIIKLNGRKLTSKNFDEELSLLLQDSDLVSKLKIADAGICRNCHNKVKGSFEFIKHLRSSCRSFVNLPYHVKRAMPSPLTPKSLQTCNTTADEANKVVQSKSRKRLKVTFENPVTMCQNTTPSLPSYHTTACTKSTMPSEHGYATVGQNLKSDSELVDPAFELIKSAWDNLIKDKENALSACSLDENVFHELRNQSKALMSRTTMFASVLFKYREANTLVEHADLLLHDIIAEMKNRCPFFSNILHSSNVI